MLTEVLHITIMKLWLASTKGKELKIKRPEFITDFREFLMLCDLGHLRIVYQVNYIIAFRLSGYCLSKQKGAV